MYELISLVLCLAVLFIVWVMWLSRDKSKERILRKERVRYSAELESMREGSHRADEDRPGSPLAGRLHCGACGEVIIVSNSRFCILCGAPLPGGVWTSIITDMGRETREVASTIEPKAFEVAPRTVKSEVKLGSTCMVCKLVLETGDQLAYCPHCGDAAHRVHLLEWLHVKGYCPRCREHLDEVELQRQLSHEEERSSSVAP